MYCSVDVLEYILANPLKISLKDLDSFLNFVKKNFFFTSSFWRRFEIVFYALNVSSNYFFHYGFIQLCILYLFFWKTSFSVFMSFLYFLFVLCFDFTVTLITFWLNNICIIIAYIGATCSLQKQPPRGTLEK